MQNYAKVIVQGSPISKSNFKLFNSKGRAILPYKSGKYHDRYALYEEQIAYETRLQNPNIILEESLICVLKVYYKSSKRHPDTNNITKSILDGIEKSGLIINDAQIRRLIIEEFYDSQNPRFELELFGESTYCMSYDIKQRPLKETPILYEPPCNKKSSSKSKNAVLQNKDKPLEGVCSICKKPVSSQYAVSANKGSVIICRDCFTKLF